MRLTNPVRRSYVPSSRGLRYTEASVYTERDTPMFPCAKAPIDAILGHLATLDSRLPGKARGVPSFRT